MTRTRIRALALGVLVAAGLVGTTAMGPAPAPVAASPLNAPCAYNLAGTWSGTYQRDGGGGGPIQASIQQLGDQVTIMYSGANVLWRALCQGNQLGNLSVHEYGDLIGQGVGQVLNNGQRIELQFWTIHGQGSVTLFP